MEKDHLYYVHSREDLIPQSQKIRDGLYWGGEFDALKEQYSAGPYALRISTFIWAIAAGALVNCTKNPGEELVHNGSKKDRLGRYEICGTMERAGCVIAEQSNPIGTSHQKILN